MELCSVCGKNPAVIFLNAKDKDIVLAAIKQDKRAKEYIASEELKNDEDIQLILNPPQEG